MSCVNFKNKEKNNKWREVELNLEKEKSISKYFGIDTETRVDELLQNNITLLDWIRKNQGYPYFIGRRINGENALSSEEISYISSNGSKTMPILRVISDKSAKENAKIAVALLEDLEIAKQTPVFAEIDADTVTKEFLKDFATEILSNEYIPGFYVDTDSYHNFDRQFSRAYQSDEKLMKQCKIWALSPEMEEFFETQNGHSEKPEIWGPFAPSCISKEQISFWQYGKKSHPIKTYKGERADFNLNLTIEPCYIFDVKNVEAEYIKIKKDKNYKFDCCVKCDNVLETVSIESDFNKISSKSLLFDNKIYGKNIISEHQILELVLCTNNDLLSPNYIVDRNKVLIKITFISNECSCVYTLRVLLDLENDDILKSIIFESMLMEEKTEKENLTSQEFWGEKFFSQNILDVSFESNNDSVVKNYIYQPNKDIFESEVISPTAMRTSVNGDTFRIFDIIPQSIVKHTGSEFCTIKDVNGNPSKAYYKYTAYDFGYYYTRIAIWDLSTVIEQSTGGNSQRNVEFEINKAYNAFAYYYPSSDSIEVVYADDNHAYFDTVDTQISINLVGCQSAYIHKCILETCMGGSEEPDYMDSILTILGWIAKPIEIIGEIASIVSNIADAYHVIEDGVDVLSNYVFNDDHEYVFHSECGLVTKQAGTIFEPSLVKKNSSLKIRALLKNVTIYPTSKVYFQIRTTMGLGDNSSQTICFGGSRPLL